jgi:hypothetical protein
MVLYESTESKSGALQEHTPKPIASAPEAVNRAVELAQASGAEETSAADPLETYKASLLSARKAAQVTSLHRQV